MGNRSQYKANGNIKLEHDANQRIQADAKNNTMPILGRRNLKTKKQIKRISLLKMGNWRKQNGSNGNLEAADCATIPYKTRRRNADSTTHNGTSAWGE